MVLGETGKEDVKVEEFIKEEATKNEEDAVLDDLLDDLMKKWQFLYNLISFIS